MLNLEYQKLKELISNNRLDKAINSLMIYTQILIDQKYHNDLTQLSARYRANKNLFDSGSLSVNEFNIENNRINSSILSLIDELFENSISQGNENKPLSLIAQKNHLNRPIKIIYIFSLVGIAGIIVFLLIFHPKIFASISNSMQLTVYVQSPDGRLIDELQNKGQIIVDFGNDRRSPIIGENGRVNLGEIPAKFHKKSINIVLKAEGFEPVNNSKCYVMNGNPIYFLVRRTKSTDTLQGIVKNRFGDKLISGALVIINNNKATYTDKFGRFFLPIPSSNQNQIYLISVKKEGFEPKNMYCPAKSKPIDIRLDN